jgi:hypothetical protein
VSPLAIKSADQPIKPEARDAAPAPSLATHDTHDFKHQLEKAKPAKKAADDAATATPTPSLALQPDQTSLAQILAAWLNGAATADVQVLPDAQTATKAIANVVTDAANATAQAAATATAQLAQGAPDKLVQQLVAVKPELPPEAPRCAMTPLEQAVHDLLSELADKKAPAGNTAMTGATFQLAPTSSVLAPISATPDVQPAGPIAPAPPPAELVSQNHAHLVFDDPNGRVVMTVAVRGSEVNVSVRATDDSTAAALARNAASLEDAMRGRGLQLAQFDAQRDLAREQHAEKPKYERDPVKKSNAERFTLEENL